MTAGWDAALPHVLGSRVGGMAVYGVHEFVLKFDTFKNVDLFRQG